MISDRKLHLECGNIYIEKSATDQNAWLLRLITSRDFKGYASSLICIIVLQDNRFDIKSIDKLMELSDEDVNTAFCLIKSLRNFI